MKVSFMRHTSFSAMRCPIALSLERVGEWWSIMILRDALRGLERFDQFQKSLGIAPNIPSRRLSGLVEAGLLEKFRYSERPPRYAYLPTERGRDFQPVLRALVAWGSKHFAPGDQAAVKPDGLTTRQTDRTMTGPDQQAVFQAIARITEVRTQP